MNKSAQGAVASTPKMAQAKHVVAAIDCAGKLSFTNITQPSLETHAEEARCVWVPTQQVRFVQVIVPGKKKSDWMQALPYMLEEQISQPVEDVFFAVYARETKGEQAGLTSVALVERSLMEAWLGECKVHGCDALPWLPDCFQLEWLASDGVSLNAESHQQWVCSMPAKPSEAGLMRMGFFSGVAGSATWLNLLADTQRKQRALTERDDGEETLTLFTQPRVYAPSKQAIQHFNLRQLEFKHVRSGKNPFMAWLIPALLVLGIFITSLLATSLQTQQLEAKSKILKKQTHALFKHMFPAVKRVVNIRVQTKTALSASLNKEKQTGLGPAELVLAVEKTIKLFVNINIRGLSWEKGKLMLQVQAPQSSQLNALKNKLKARHTDIKVTLNIKKISKQSATANLVLSGGRS